MVNLSCRTVVRAVVVSLAGTIAAPAMAQEVVVVGDSLAVDQPRVLFALEDPANPGETFGPPFYNSALLDTAANGILLGELAYLDPDTGTVDPNFYPIARRADGSLVQYEEIGVAGTAFLDVLEPFDLNFAGDDGAIHVIPDTRILGAPFGNFGSFAAILGMPVLNNRVTHVNLKPVAQLDFMQSNFISSRPAPTPNTYTVPLTKLPAETPGQIEPADPLPTFADIPMIDVRTEAKGLSADITLVLDSGGQASIISRAAALQMGMILDPNDPNTDVVGSLEIGGLGGTTEVPFVQIDRLVLPTAQGIDLVFTDLQVGVLDIAGLGGIIGMNVLASGYGDLIFGGGEPDEYGVFSDVYFDFSTSDWTMQLEMNPAYNVVVPEPNVAAVMLLAGTMTCLARRRRRTQR